MTYWILLKTTFACPQSCQNKEMEESIFFIIIGLGFKKRNYMHFSKQDSAIQLMHQIKPIFDPKGILNPYTCLPDVKWIPTSKHIFVIKLEYDLLVTWVQIWNTFFYIFWYWFHFKSMNSPIHLVRFYTIKFYNSNLDIANHNLRFTNFLREKI